jgi:hypothetical protein
MSVDTHPQQPIGQPPAAQAADRFRSLRAWLGRDNGIWTDLFYGAVPVVLLLALSAIPGNTLVRAVTEYSFVALLMLAGILIYGFWRRFQAWHRKRPTRSR